MMDIRRSCTKLTLMPYNATNDCKCLEYIDYKEFNTIVVLLITARDEYSHQIPLLSCATVPRSRPFASRSTHYLPHLHPLSPFSFDILPNLVN